MTAVGIFTGIAGLGLGYATGVAWEQFHRHRRRARLKERADAPGDAETIHEMQAVTAPRAAIESPPRDPDVPRLQLVSPEKLPFPNLVGRRLASVRFLAHTVELDFGGVQVGIYGSPSIRCGTQLFRYPDAGSRDALCSLIGARVNRMRTTAGDRIELALDSGCELVIPKAGVAVA